MTSVVVTHINFLRHGTVQRVSDPSAIGMPFQTAEHNALLGEETSVDVSPYNASDYFSF